MPELDLEAIRPTLRAALAEDVGPGDVTGELLVPEDARAIGRVVAKAPGVLAGVPVAIEVMRLDAEGDLVVRHEVADGTRVLPGAPVLVVEGPGRSLVRSTRTALNFLIRLSGVATLTAKFVEAVRGTAAAIYDTRKTTPGLRVLERYAVRRGGGRNHRFGLYDAVLVKENHRAFGAPLAAALASRPEGMEVIVEAESLGEFLDAREVGADVVLLDELSLDDLREARRLRGASPRPRIEVSGGVTLENVRAYAEAGAERISVGALTHSAPALDFSMRIEPIA